ncbi:protein SSUH2 homolog [Saccoglossus kowalevskii]
MASFVHGLGIDITTTTTGQPNHASTDSNFEDDDNSNHGSNYYIAMENVDVDVANGNSDLSELGTPPEYESLGYTDSTVPPPQVSVQQPQLQEHRFTELPYLSEHNVRTVLIDYVADHFCYGNRAAREMNINNIIPSNALHYELISFTECRHTKHISEPYRGGEVDGPLNGTPPSPWDIEISYQQIFVDEVKYLEVPHTSTIKSCHTCRGSGRVECGSCCGRKKVLSCSSCDGDGRGHATYTTYQNNRRVTKSKLCGGCSGSGKVVCGTCGGLGSVTCKTCRGTKELRWYVQLTVTFANMIDEHVVEHTDLPNHLIKDVHGTVIFQETENLVQPIMNHPDQELNTFSKSLLDSHVRMCQTDMKKIHRQKHIVRAVPVSEVHWTWQTKGSRFWVYGNGRTIYITKYPQKNCWGCQIL